jgi:CrcB protein
MTQPGPEGSLPFDPDVEVAARGARRRDRFDVRLLLLVAFGGALGAPARYGVAQVVHVGTHGFPWATFWTNVSGAFALGVVLVLVTERFPQLRSAQPFLATGFLGAYTTFSTFVVEGDLLVRDGHAFLAAVYWVTSIAAGLFAAVAGIAVARRRQVTS